jgi:hypothetical protein
MGNVHWLLQPALPEMPGRAAGRQWMGAREAELLPPSEIGDIADRNRP